MKLPNLYLLKDIMPQKSGKILSAKVRGGQGRIDTNRMFGTSQYDVDNYELDTSFKRQNNIKLEKV